MVCDSGNVVGENGPAVSKRAVISVENTSHSRSSRLCEPRHQYDERAIISSPPLGKGSKVQSHAVALPARLSKKSLPSRHSMYSSSLDAANCGQPAVIAMPGIEYGALHEEPPSSE